jgi:transposase
MKRGTTRLAYKPGHAVDLGTGVIVAARIDLTDQDDTHIVAGTLKQHVV